QKPGADKRAAAQALLEEFLPLDDQRRLESAAWLSFINAARTEASLRPYARTMHEGTRTIIGRVIKRIAESGKTRQPFNEDVETDRLAALLDGLTLQGVLHPDSPNAAAARAVLRRHLDSLLAVPQSS
ncbi:MAG: TetR family transcriptional regulator C-terminal domain-containing protein, partial [Stackebrandtia sp.]